MENEAPVSLTAEINQHKARIYRRALSLKSQFPVDADMSPRLDRVGVGGPDHLNVGSGVNPIPGAFNVDIQKFQGVDVCFDFAQPWPLDDETWDKVTLFHCLEHVPPLKALEIVKEAYRVLRPEGLLIVEVPDIEGMCREVVAGNYGMLVGPLYGGYDAPFDAHRFGYTTSSLALLCHLGGFVRLLTGAGTDYHSAQMPTIRCEAVKIPPRALTLAGVPA